MIRCEMVLPALGDAQSYTILVKDGDTDVRKHIARGSTMEKINALYNGKRGPATMARCVR